MIKQLTGFCVLAIAIALSGCDGKTNEGPAKQSVTPETTKQQPAATEETSTASAVKGKAWADLDANQKSVLSVLEQVWPNIPAAKQNRFLESADQWSSTDAKGQYAVIEDMYKVLGEPVPDVYKKNFNIETK